MSFPRVDARAAKSSCSQVSLLQVEDVSPLPYPSATRAARSWSFVAQSAVPIERALFCRRSSQALSVESPATAPVLRLTPPPSWIANGRFAQPFLGRRRPTDRYIAAELVHLGVVRPGSRRCRVGQPGSLPCPAAACFLRSTRPLGFCRPANFPKFALFISTSDARFLLISC
jgi:hypothetical protein